MAGEAVELMCREFEIETIRIAAGTARTKGDVFAQQDALCIAMDDEAVADEVVGIVKAPHVIGPKAAVAITAGQDAYFVAGAPGSFTNVLSGRKCGNFKFDTALSAAQVELAFDGYGS